jgi:hypothetical protein
LARCTLGPWSALAVSRVQLRPGLEHTSPALTCRRGLKNRMASHEAIFVISLSFECWEAWQVYFRKVVRGALLGSASSLVIVGCCVAPVDQGITASGISAVPLAQTPSEASGEIATSPGGAEVDGAGLQPSSPVGASSGLAGSPTPTEPSSPTTPIPVDSPQIPPDSDTGAATTAQSPTPAPSQSPPAGVRRSGHFRPGADRLVPATHDRRDHMPTRTWAFPCWCRPAGPSNS